MDELVYPLHAFSFLLHHKDNEKGDERESSIKRPKGQE
jgi:hypothetical protein